MSAFVEATGYETFERLLERLDDYTVVDCDYHQLNEDTSVFVPYLDEEWQPHAEHLATSLDPVTQGIGGSYPYEVLPDFHGESLYGLPPEITPHTPAGTAAFMDHFRTDFVILQGHQEYLFANLADGDFASALFKARNDYLLAEWLPHHDGFKAGIMVNVERPHQAAAEIHRLADEPDMVSVSIPGRTEKPLGHPAYEPVFEAAAEHGLGIEMHPSASTPEWSSEIGSPPPISDIEYKVGFHHQILSQIPSLVFQGVFERYPDLHVVCLEAGVAWIPALLARMDKNYERRRHQFPDLSRRPSEYVREQCFFGTQPMEDVAGSARMRQLLEMMGGAELLVYTSDFPHFDFDYPSVLTIPSLSEADERRIFGENAMNVYGLTD